MVKFRLQSEDLEEIEAAIELLESLFPEMRFTAPRLGSNPKYADNQKYMAYGEPRTSKGSPMDVNFLQKLKKLQAHDGKRKKTIT